MSQPPDAPDPYLPPQPGQQQPYQQQGYPQQQWTGGASDLTAGRDQDHVRRDKPTTVVRLVRVMWAGMVLAVLSGVHGLLSVDSAVAEAMQQVERDLVGSGMDVESFAGFAGTISVVTVLVTSVVVAGLWGLFAWLFGRGQGRVVGTVLGAINGVGTLGGLFFYVDPLDLVLQLLTLAVVVGALVLLWLPATSTWFRAVKAGGPNAGWT